MIFDSHAHYDDEAFNEDRESVIKDIQDKGVIGVLNCGSDLRGVELSIELSNKHEFMYLCYRHTSILSDIVNES